MLEGPSSSVTPAQSLHGCAAAMRVCCVQDPTCLCGSEAAIDRKLLGERRVLEEGSLVVLEQVR